MSEEAVKVGDRFLHARLLRDDYRTPQECRITAIRQGVVYYKPVDGGGSEYIEIEKFPNIVKKTEE